MKFCPKYICQLSQAKLPICNVQFVPEGGFKLSLTISHPIQGRALWYGKMYFFDRTTTVCDAPSPGCSSMQQSLCRCESLAPINLQLLDSVPPFGWTVPIRMSNQSFAAIVKKTKHTFSPIDRPTLSNLPPLVWLSNWGSRNALSPHQPFIILVSIRPKPNNRSVPRPLN